MNRLKITPIIATLALGLVLSPAAAVAQDEAPTQILFTDVNIFDGVHETRIENASVLVEGNLIKTISTDPISAGGATVIDGGGGR